MSGTQEQPETPVVVPHFESAGGNSECRCTRGKRVGLVFRASGILFKAYTLSVNVCRS